MSASHASDASGKFAEAALHLFPAEVAIVDSRGVIVSTNQAWRMFGEANGLVGESDMIGVNYLDVCDAAGAEDTDAAAAAEGIRAVIDGTRDTFSLEYPCHSPDKERWFLMRVIPFRVGGEQYALAAHMDVTDRKLVELDVRTRTDQFEAIATLLSEDLQESLSTALGRAILLTRETESEQSVQLEASLQQMHALLTDALALLRGEPVDVTDVSVEATTAAAWGRIDTLDATLDVTASGVLEADLSLFGQLFQHLFQSALIQGGSDVNIEVGADGDTLYVEYGRNAATTAVVEGAGTASALDPDVAVATRIADVHGWTLTSTPNDGGIRHEITGIQWRV